MLPSDLEVLKLYGEVVVANILPEHQALDKRVSVMVRGPLYLFSEYGVDAEAAARKILEIMRVDLKIAIDRIENP